MKIAIEASFANETKKTGLGVYTEKLLSALAAQKKARSFTWEKAAAELLKFYRETV